MDIVVADRRAGFGYRHVIVVTLFVLYVVNYFDRISVLTFLPFIRNDLHLSHRQIGFVGSIFFFAYAVAQISAGFLADKFGPRRVISIAIVVFTTITFLTGLARNFVELVFLRLFLGLGEGHQFVPSCKTIANWVPKSEKGRAMAFFSSTWQIAPAIVPIVVTSLAAWLGSWRPVFYLLAIPGIVAGLLLYYVISDEPEEMLSRKRLSQDEYDYIKATLVSEEGSNTKVSMREVVKDVSLWLWALQQFCQLAIYWGSTTWISSFLYEQYGMGLKRIGLIISIPYMVGLISTNVGGALMDKVFHRTKPVALISLVGSIPLLIFMGHIPKGKPVELIVMLAVTGFFTNLILGVVNAYPQMRYPKEIVGKVIGLTVCVGQMGAFISPLLAGYLVRTTPAGVSYDRVFLMFATCSALGAVVTSFMKEGAYIN